MKKIIICIILLSFGDLASAQRFHIIPKIGVNLADVNFDSDHEWEGQESLPAIIGGVALNVGISRILSLQPEIIYSQKGFAVKESGIVDYDGTYRLDYIEIPVLLKTTFGSGLLEIYLNAGPTFGYFLGGRVKGSWNLLIQEEINKSIKFTEEPKELQDVNANRIEVGIGVGGGLNIGITKFTKVVLDYRYGDAFTNYSKDYKSKNKTNALVLGLQMGIGE